MIGHGIRRRRSENMSKSKVRGPNCICPLVNLEYKILIEDHMDSIRCNKKSNE